MRHSTVLLFAGILSIVWCSTVAAESVDRAIVISGNLRVRSLADLDGGVVGKLDERDTVMVLDRSDAKTKIGDMEDYWYKIQRADLIGWTYGYFLSLAKHEFPESGITVHFGTSMDRESLVIYHLFSPHGDRKFDSEGSLVFSTNGVSCYRSDRQEILGWLTIFDSVSGRQLWTDRFTGRRPQWDGDDLLYQSVVDEQTEGKIEEQWVSYEWVRFAEEVAHRSGEVVKWYFGKEPGSSGPPPGL